MIYGSVCSGIEAATVAWHPLGWRPAFFAEIDKFPSAVLHHHYPDVPNLGDFTRIETSDAIDVLVGGTPCQSFSVAGLRGGLADGRGNLALEYLRLAQRTRARWLVWENVPGVLSSNGGRDFGAILGGMVELGYGFAYRVLDAQFFGVPQRRRRVFVVGYLGNWRRAAAVLFERHSLSGHPSPRRETGEGVAPTISARPTAGGGLRTDFDCDGGLVAFGGNNCSGPVEVAAALGAHAGPAGRLDFASETFIAFSVKDHGADAGELAPTLRAGGHSKSHANAGVMPAIAFGTQMSTPHWQHGLSDTLQAKNPKGVVHGMSVRRLTPRECERLQGFPDDYTLIPWRGKLAPDGPRYKALGNSFAVPVVRWIGERIQMVEDMCAKAA